MARDNKGFVCHSHRNKVSYEIHHVWPTAYHGPDKAWNRIKICPNAHSDIHFLMEAMFKKRKIDLRDYGHTIQEFAKSGYDQVIAYAESLAEISNAQR